MKNDTEVLDDFDLAILRILQKENTLPHRLIGEQVNLSAPSVQRRIKRLESTRIITMQSAIVDPARLSRDRPMNPTC